MTTLNKAATNHEDEETSQLLVPCANSPVLMLGALSFIDDSTKPAVPPLFDEDPICSRNCSPLLLDASRTKPTTFLSKMNHSGMMSVSC